MDNSCSIYIKQVERALNLPRRQKKELLRGFRAELKEKFSESPSTERLLADMGQPEEVAATLLEAVDTREYIRFNATRLRWFRCAIVVLVLLLITAVGAIIYSYATELKRVEITIVEDPIPTQYSMDAEK